MLIEEPGTYMDHLTWVDIRKSNSVLNMVILTPGKIGDITDRISKTGKVELCGKTLHGVYYELATAIAGLGLGASESVFNSIKVASACAWHTGDQLCTAFVALDDSQITVEPTPELRVCFAKKGEQHRIKLKKGYVLLLRGVDSNSVWRHSATGWFAVLRYDRVTAS